MSIELTELSVSSATYCADDRLEDLPQPPSLRKAATGTCAVINLDASGDLPQPPPLRKAATGKCAVIDLDAAMEDVADAAEVSSSQTWQAKISSKWKLLRQSAKSLTQENTLDVHNLSTSAQDGDNHSEEEEAQTDAYNLYADVETAALAYPWEMARDDEGGDYYWNTETDETTYDKPEGNHGSGSTGVPGTACQNVSSDVHMASDLPADPSVPALSPSNGFIMI
jgi:hypothetical protein